MFDLFERGVLVVAENVTLIANETINQTTQTFLQTSVDYTQHTLLPRVVDLVIAPIENPDMIWTLGPMIIALVLMQLYFGRNKDEALGWNTAFGNSIALIFISVSLLRGVFLESGDVSIMGFLRGALAFNDLQIVVVAFLFLYGIFLALLSFFHWIPEKLAFFIMNAISVNVTAYIIIVLVNSENIPLDRHTLFAGFVMFILVYLLSMAIRFFVPQSIHSRIHLLERKKYIVEADVRLYQQKVDKAGTDARRQKFSKRLKEYEQKVKDLDTVIKGLEIQAR